MTLWLVRSSPDRAARVRALAGDIALCSWARHVTLTVPLSTQVYRWVQAHLMLGVTLMGHLTRMQTFNHGKKATSFTYLYQGQQLSL